MAVRHAMLVMARAVYDVVEIPGQEPLVVPKGAGDDATRQWWDENVKVVAAKIFRENNASWQRKLAEWNARTVIDFGKERLHEGGPRVDVARIRFPDGSESAVPPEAAKDYVAEAFREENPPPTVAAQFADWREAVQVARLRPSDGLLFEVLGFSAAEIATMTATSTTSVNSALARARKIVAEKVPSRTQQQTLRQFGDARVREIVTSY